MAKTKQAPAPKATKAVKPTVSEGQEAKKNYIWIDHNYGSLRQKYAGEFVAVFGEKVIGHDMDCSRLSQKLGKRYQLSAIEYISKEDHEFAL